MTNGDDYAFPKPDMSVNASQGLTKREYFAAMAMNGLCANGILKPNEVTEITERSTILANALINELSKPK